jgi:hypothetical protein
MKDVDHSGPAVWGMKAYGGSGCIDPHFLEVSGQLHAPAPLPELELRPLGRQARS